MSAPGFSWACAACTGAMPASITSCEYCGTPRPDALAGSAGEWGDWDSDAGMEVWEKGAGPHTAASAPPTVCTWSCASCRTAYGPDVAECPVCTWDDEDEVSGEGAAPRTLGFTCTSAAEVGVFLCWGLALW